MDPLIGVPTLGILGWLLKKSIASDKKKYDEEMEEIDDRLKGYREKREDLERRVR